MPPQRSNVENLVERLWTPSSPAVVMDGGVGIEFRDRAAAYGIFLIKGLWSATALRSDLAQDILYEVHRDFLEIGGAEIIIANTFRTQSTTYQAARQRDSSREDTRDAVQIALQARDDSGNPNVIVAYSAGPLNDCYKPIPGLFTAKELEEGHTIHAENAAGAGAELAVCETLPSLEEAEAAINAANSVNLKSIVSFYTVGDGSRLPDGTTLIDAANHAKKLGAIVVADNCVGPTKGKNGVQILTNEENLRTPVGTWVQGYERGCSELEPQVPIDQYPDHVAEKIRQCIRLGARLVGGCCNVTPEDIRKIKNIAEEEANASIHLQMVA